MTAAIASLAAVGSALGSAASAVGSAAVAAGSAVASGIGSVGAATLGTAGVTAAADSAAAYTVGGLVAAQSLASAGLSAYEGVSSYQQGKAEAATLKDQAEAAEAEARGKANEMNRQASLEDIRAGIAQVGGEREAEKRSRLLAQDIGSMYADFAGNGLLVDGSSKDVVGAALRTQVGEAQSDISTIRDNSAMEVWTHMANASSYRASAANALTAGHNQATVLRSQAKSARKRGRSGLAMGLGKAGLSLGGLGLRLAAGMTGGSSIVSTIKGGGDIQASLITPSNGIPGMTPLEHIGTTGYVVT